MAKKSEAGKGDDPRSCFSKDYRNTNLSIFGARCARCGEKIENPQGDGDTIFFCDRNKSCGIFE